MNELINGLYNKIDNQEKIIRELQEENQELKNDCEDLFQQKQSMFENMLLNQEKTLNCIETIKELKERIDKANNELITVIQIILEQPSNDPIEDRWLFDRLESISNILGDNNE